MHSWLNFKLLFPVFFIAQFSFAETPRVILLTMDGVRWDEVFVEKLMPNLTGPLSEEGTLYGDGIRSIAEVENSTNISLPGYQNIFLGHPSRCKGNQCLKTNENTIIDELRTSLDLKKDDLAAFTSWGKIRRAFAKRKCHTTHSFGLSRIKSNDPYFKNINQTQKKDLPPWGVRGLPIARYDQYTFDAGFHYLKTEKPRFLYIGLLDSDEWAHAGNMDGYRKSIQDFDQRIAQVVDYLKANPEIERETLLIVTTDHGRGTGENWIHHGPEHPHSKKIWMYVRTPKEKAGFLATLSERVSHNDVRKLISEWMKTKI